jgi:hypothetical protein
VVTYEEGGGILGGGYSLILDVFVGVTTLGIYI